MKKTCEYCGKPFIGGSQRRFCSYRCMGRSRIKPIMEKVCLRCGKTFRTKTKDREFCSLFCKRKYKESQEAINAKKNKSNFALESKWWLDECPFHNGQISSDFQKNMATWYFI